MNNFMYEARSRITPELAHVEPKFRAMLELAPYSVACSTLVYTQIFFLCQKSFKVGGVGVTLL